MMETACGVLEWTPQVFWSSTFFEYSHTVVGYMKKNKLGKWGSGFILDYWNEDDFKKAKEELKEINKDITLARDMNLDKETRRRLKAMKRERREAKK